MGLTAGNTDLGKVFELVAATAGGASQIFDNHNHRGVKVAVNLTATSGASPIMTVIVEGYDSASNNFYPLLTSANLTVPEFVLLTLYPGIDSVAHLSVSQILPASWRIRYTLSGPSSNISATFGACLLK